MLKFIFEFSIITTVLVLSLLYSPIFLECNPQSYSVNLPESFEGPLAVNDKLSKAEKFVEGKLLWPESLAVYEGDIYTGINDGHIVKISNDKVEPILRTGKKDCEGQWEEAQCGRPLGMRILKDGTMYVADASFGLLSINLKKKKAEILVPSTKQIEGLNLTLMNDVAVHEDGILYFSQSSTKWQLATLILSLLDHDCSGRLLSYNPKTKEIKVLAKGLGLANGVEISHDGNRVIVAECSNHQILQYYLNGPKKGKIEPLLSDLPGEPDNIRRSQKGGYWVAFNGVRTKDKAISSDKMSEYPAVRKIVMRLIHLTGSILTYVSNFVPYPTFKSISFNVKSGRFLVNLENYHGMIMRFDDDGKIIESLHSPDGRVAHLSEVLEHNGHLYVGSWRNNFIAKLKQ